jgi:hypothetical protein
MALQLIELNGGFVQATAILLIDMVPWFLKLSVSTPEGLVEPGTVISPEAVTK